MSTDGLGTSYSLSDRSTDVDTPLLRPGFMNIKGKNGSNDVNLMTALLFDVNGHFFPLNAEGN